MHVLTELRTGAKVAAFQRYAESPAHAAADCAMRGSFSEDDLEARLNCPAPLRSQTSSESAVRTSSLFAACSTLLTVVDGNK